MTYPTTTLNAWLAGQDINSVSVHSAFPGTTGANEISGGPYARQTIVLNAPSGGQRLMNSPVFIPVPACTVRWFGAWNNTTFVAAAPNGGALPKNFMAVPSSDLVYATGHGYSDTNEITFFGGPPAPLVEGTTYFVRDATTDTFKVAATSGGSAIDLTTASSAGCWVVAITVDVYASPDTHPLANLSVTIPT
jgi:hypothetical protein